MAAYNENGDLLAKEGQAFRQVGWQIHGGENNGKIVVSQELEDVLKAAPHGGYAPVYIEVGD